MTCHRRSVFLEILFLGLLLGGLVYFGGPGDSFQGTYFYWIALAAGAVFLPWSVFGLLRALRSEHGFIYWILDAEGGRSPDFGSFRWDDVDAVGELTNPYGKRGHYADRFFIELSNGRRIKFQRKPRGVDLREVHRLTQGYFARSGEPFGH